MPIALGIVSTQAIAILVHYDLSPTRLNIWESKLNETNLLLYHHHHNSITLHNQMIITITILIIIIGSITVLITPSYHTSVASGLISKPSSSSLQSSNVAKYPSGISHEINEDSSPAKPSPSISSYQVVALTASSSMLPLQSSSSSLHISIPLTFTSSSLSSQSRLFVT